MKKLITISTVIVVVIISMFFMINSNVIEENRKDMSLPEYILSVHKILFHQTLKSVIAVADFGDSHGLVMFDGITWTTLLHIEDTYSYAHIFIDSNGVIYYSDQNPVKTYRSTDLGNTWEVVTENIGVFWGLTDDKKGTHYATLWAGNDPVVYNSIDNGVSWQVWKHMWDIFPEEKEFYGDQTTLSKMRHTHDIIALSDRVIIGTGDVTRWAIETRDNGETWKKIWDEGFTSHIYDSKKQNILLFGDKGYRYGVAFYDINTPKAIDVWKPEDEDINWMSGSYIYSSVKIDNRYYAATHVENNSPNDVTNYGILASQDGKNWEPIYHYETTASYTELYIAEGIYENTMFISHEGGLSQLDLK
ncbi:MAG: hypothetical protein HOE80_00690 [Candidatus Magasanikbacteria bacterium]|jgi:hypothetical protein|nr:hypothetical protein [Candidatus Magasanikbacteria bacterium]MBT4071224.1 hypothetical protein [Candidatus Magasanikbacteria bacterium]